MILRSDLEAGAHNLLINCAGLKPGAKVLIVAEDPALGWYDAEAAEAVATEARVLGAEVTQIAVGAPADGPPPALPEWIAAHDISVFFARVGDQHRFCDSLADHVCVVSYARTARALASAYGRTDHGRMVEMKNRTAATLWGAQQIEVTCPNGTLFQGMPPPGVIEPEDVTIRRFPLCMPAPMPASGFSGRVALRGYLTPTGSRAYQPAWLALDETVMAEVSSGRIIGFEGPRALVHRIEAHYAHVADLFGLDPWVVHSWHGGIHTGCPTDMDVHENPDRWANTVFGNPGYLHFHTCGGYAPGEICWMITQPTVRLDGKPLWDRGQLILD